MKTGRHFVDLFFYAQQLLDTITQKYWPTIFIGKTITTKGHKVNQGFPSCTLVHFVVMLFAVKSGRAKNMVSD
jgi:hypothetical protein